LGKVGVATEIAKLQTKQLPAADLNAVRVLEEFQRIGFSDISAVFDEHSGLKPLRTGRRKFGRQLRR
jgi:hypothetical protein